MILELTIVALALIWKKQEQMNPYLVFAMLTIELIAVVVIEVWLYKSKKKKASGARSSTSS